MANILDETGSLLKAILGLDYGNKQDLIGDTRKGTNVLEDAHEGSSVKPMDVNQVGELNPYDLTDAQLLDENALDAHVASLAQKYASGVEGALPITSAQETAPNDLSAVQGIYGDLTQSTQDLMKLYGMDSSKLDALGDFGIGDVLSSVDKQVKATEDYTHGMIESIDKRREILEKKPKANWMILVAAALLPKRKAAGLVSGYYKGIMERYDRDIERQLAILDDEMKKTKFELDLEGARAGASESKMKLKMGMLQAVSQNIELAKKVQEITYSGTISKLAADISLKMINNNGEFPSDEELTNELKMAGVDENSIPIALSQLSSMISQNVYNYRTSAKLRTVGGSGSGSGGAGTSVPPNLFGTGNDEKINLDFSVAQDKFNTALVNVKAQDIALQFTQPRKGEPDPLAIWKGIFDARFKNAYKDMETTDIMKTGLTAVSHYFLRPDLKSTKEIAPLVAQLIPVATKVRAAIEKTKSGAGLIAGFDLYKNVESLFSQFEAEAESFFNTTTRYLYGTREIDVAKKNQFLSNVRNQFIGILKDVGSDKDPNNNVDITQNLANWKNGESFISNMFTEVINVSGPIDITQKNLRGLLEEAYSTNLGAEARDISDLSRTALFGSKTTPFNNFVKSAQDLATTAFRYYEFLLSTAVTSQLPLLIEGALTTIDRDMSGQKGVLAKGIISSLLLMGTEPANPALFWAINPNMGLADIKEFTEGPKNNINSASSLSPNVKVNKEGNIKAPDTSINMDASAVTQNIQNKNNDLVEQAHTFALGIVDKLPKNYTKEAYDAVVARKKQDIQSASRVETNLKDFISKSNLLDESILNDTQMLDSVVVELIKLLAATELKRKPRGK